ncbi:MAG: hypothetical protein KME32_26015 [Mojavia pulchra JT2-VF2]|uniref:Calcium-binding protein n=1 Tax=Mojavia pulchra JT2-VF2 TaxID=287848 RepID=A0A951UIX8_9NOST|nr:hypothetical protein [Mojavia pulchra JT2-VF2]
MSGNDGYDVVQVNGAPVGDNFRLQQDAQGRAIFDRLNLVPFTLTVDTAEKFEINGQGGDDILDVNSLAATSVTLVEFKGGAGNDLLDGSGTTTSLQGYGNDGNDTLNGGTSNDTLYGDAGNDLLRGGAGKDTLYGGTSNDYLLGGYGADVLYGGAGADKFVFNSVSQGIDIIKDFQKDWAQPSLSDKIEISKVGFGASSISQFNYDSSSGALSFLGTQFATIENKPAGFSTTTDIVLV